MYEYGVHFSDGTKLRVLNCKAECSCSMYANRGHTINCYVNSIGRNQAVMGQLLIDMVMDNIYIYNV